MAPLRCAALRPQESVLKFSQRESQLQINQTSLQAMSNATTCPSCHQNIPNQPQSRTFEGLPDDKVTFIHQEIYHIDQQIAQLRRDRAFLSRNLNAVQSLVVRLPTETLSSIFEHACPPPDLSDLHVYRYYHTSSVLKQFGGDYFQFILSGVSSH